jgi:hypothetical protein
VTLNGAQLLEPHALQVRVPLEARREGAKRLQVHLVEDLVRVARSTRESEAAASFVSISMIFAAFALALSAGSPTSSNIFATCARYFSRIVFDFSSSFR